jgi:hypothetical protein
MSIAMVVYGARGFRRTHILERKLDVLLASDGGFGDLWDEEYDPRSLSS